MHRQRIRLLSSCLAVLWLGSSTLTLPAVSLDLTDNVTHEIGNLRDQDRGIRASAAHTLGEMKDRRATAALTVALKDGDGQVRAAAVLALGELKDPESIESLITALKDENPEVQGYAAMALGEFKDSRSVAALISLLNKPHREDDATAASALGRIGALAFDPLAAQLKSQNPEMRTRAVEALGWMKDGNAFNALVVGLHDQNPAVRAAAVAGLNGHWDAPGLMQAPFGLMPWLQTAREWKPGWTRDLRVIDLLIQALVDKDARVQSTAIEELGKIDTPRAIEPLLAFLTSVSMDGKDKAARDASRLQAVRALGYIKDRRVVPTLIGMLKDPDEQLREQAAQSLGEVKDPEAVDALIAASLRDGSVMVRIGAIKALGKIKDARAVEPLIGELSDKTFQVRESAAMALGEIGDPRAVDPMMALVKSNRAAGVPVGPLQLGSVGALAQIGTPAIESLTQAAKDPDATIRVAAVSALAAIRDPKVIAPLMDAMSEENVEIRSSAARGLAWNEDQRAEAPVLAALKDKERNVRESAVEGLCWNHSTWVIRPMIVAMRDPDSGFAERCLNAAPQRIQSPITDPFIALLKDPDTHVRGLAAEALSKIVSEDLMLRGLQGADASMLEALEGTLHDKDTASIYGAFMLFVGLGKAGSEDALVEAFNEHGDQWMASYLLTCGNAKLEDAGRAWFTKHNTRLEGQMTGPVWGSEPVPQETAGKP